MNSEEANNEINAYSEYICAGNSYSNLYIIINKYKI